MSHTDARYIFEEISPSKAGVRGKVSCPDAIQTCPSRQGVLEIDRLGVESVISRDEGKSILESASQAF